MIRNTDKAGLRFAGKSAALFVAAITASIGAVTSAAAQTPSESLVYSFAGGTSDGAKPLAGLYIDSSNNLYGATYSGGLYGQGTVFEFASGATSDTILCNLPGGYDTGSHPGAGAWGTPVVNSGLFMARPLTTPSPAVRFLETGSSINARRAARPIRTRT